MEEMNMTTKELRDLCVQNAWLTRGTDEQIEKLFYAHRMGCPIDGLATMIWLLSDEDVCRRDIIVALKAMGK